MDSDMPVENAIVQGVIHIPELIRHILSFTEINTLPATARVCWLWYPNALDMIWQNCSLFDLLQTFCPLVWDDTNQTWDFNGYGNWERFLHHALRVVQLRHDDTLHQNWLGTPHTETLAFQAIMTIESHFLIDPDPILLPKLQSIYLISRHSPSLLQMVPFIARATQLEELNGLFIGTGSQSTPFRSLRTMAKTLPPIVVRIRLEVENIGDTPPDLSGFIDALRCKTALFHLGFLNQELSPGVCGMLGQLTALRMLEFGIDGPMLVPLLTTLQQSAPMLQDLRLHTLRPLPDLYLPFAMLRPLLLLSHLTTFYFLDSYAVLLTEDDIISMGHAWPLMETLHLPSTIGAGSEDPGIPLRWLDTFSRELPHLRALSVYFDNFDNLPSTDNIQRFSRLQTLAIGCSNSNNGGKLHEVVEFIAAVCPPGVAILSSNETSEQLESAFERDQEIESVPFWDDVSALVKVVHRMEAAVIRRIERTQAGG